MFEWVFTSSDLMLLPLFFLFLRGSQSHKKHFQKPPCFFDSPWLRKLETQPTFFPFKKTLRSFPTQRMLGFMDFCYKKKIRWTIPNLPFPPTASSQLPSRLPRSLLGYAVGALTSTFDIPPETPIQTLLGGELWQSVCEVGWFRQVIVSCPVTSSMNITIIWYVL